MKMSSLVSFDSLKSVAIACLLYTVLSWLFGWTAKKKRTDRVSLDSNKKRVAKNSDGPITSEAQYLRSQLSQTPASINEANHTDPPAEKETSPFVHLIAEMKYEICSFLSDSEKFELLKSANREKLELLKSTNLPRKDNYIYFLHKYLRSEIRSNDDIRAAVDAWCRDPVAAEIKYGHISGWDTSLVTDTKELFKDKRNFNDDISQWNVSNVTRMDHMFNGATAFNQDISKWNVSKVTRMEFMFYSARAFNQPLEKWNVSNVSDMQFMFCSAWKFNQPIGQWDVSHVTTMEGMFNNARAFNQPIGNWNVSRVRYMNRMFSGAAAFNQDIGQWNVSQVTIMRSMFCGAAAFNQAIGQWNVSQVTDMVSMFNGASRMQNANKPPKCR